jgi:nitrile hydratase accessory protein|nr:nitrile hydratase accessory protein [uncultured Azospirillum sp.]
MLTRFEHFALTSMAGAEDSPPRANGSLCFAEEWERSAFGVALALAREGHFEWEDFRRNLIAAIGNWERTRSFDSPSWSYYEQWLSALEATILQSGLATPDELSACTAAATAPADTQSA